MGHPHGGRPAINRWAQFENGSIEVQDEGSQLLALLVAPRLMIIDFCAGAGGKTLLLGALMRSTGRLYAFDVSAARLARATAFARSGLSNVVPVAIDSENDTRIKRLAGRLARAGRCAVRIGTLRRNPDLKWRQHPEALAELGQLQERILNSARAAWRRAVGWCTPPAACWPRKTRSAERFLASHPEFERLDAAAILAGRCENLKLEGPYVQLRPDLHGTDGFFAAVFERKKAGAKTEQDAEPLALEAEARWTTHRRKPGRMPARRRIRQPAKPPESPADLRSAAPRLSAGAPFIRRGRDVHGSAVATDASVLFWYFTSQARVSAPGWPVW